VTLQIGGMATTLILAPHIDDEVLGCFSFLGPESHVLWFGLATIEQSSLEIRKAEAQALSQHFGFGFTLLNHQLNHYHPADLIDDVEKAIHTIQPKTLLLPQPSYHQDHRSVFEAGFTACRHHEAIPFVRQVLVYEQVHAQRWPRNEFQAQLFNPILIESKLEAWDLLASQHRGHRKKEHIEQLATMRGFQANAAHAEAFQILRMVAS